MLAIYRVVFHRKMRFMIKIEIKANNLSETHFFGKIEIKANNPSEIHFLLKIEILAKNTKNVTKFDCGKS